MAGACCGRMCVSARVCEWRRGVFPDHCVGEHTRSAPDQPSSSSIDHFTSHHPLVPRRVQMVGAGTVAGLSSLPPLMPGLQPHEGQPLFFVCLLICCPLLLRCMPWVAVSHDMRWGCSTCDAMFKATPSPPSFVLPSPFPLGDIPPGLLPQRRREGRRNSLRPQREGADCSRHRQAGHQPRIRGLPAPGVRSEWDERGGGVGLKSTQSIGAD